MLGAQSMAQLSCVPYLIKEDLEAKLFAAVKRVIAAEEELKIARIEYEETLQKIQGSSGEPVFAKTPKTGTPRRQMVLEYVAQHPGVDVPTIIEDLSLSRNTVRYVLWEAEKKQRVEKIGKGYRLVSEAERSGSRSIKKLRRSVVMTLAALRALALL